MADAQTVAVERTRAALARDRGIAAGTIEVVKVVRSLEPHAPGEIDIGPLYAFAVTLRAGGQTYRYRYFRGHAERLS